MQGVRTITPEEALRNLRWAVLVTRADGVEFIEELTFSESVATEIASRLRLIYAPEGGTVEVAHVVGDDWRELDELPVFLDVERAAELMGVSAEHVRRMCRKGSIKAERFGALWRINTAALLQQYGLVER